MRAAARLILPALLAALAACEHQGGATPAALTTAPPPVADGNDGEEPGPADYAAVPGDLAVNPARLTGLGQRVVRAALGPPNFRRRDKGVEIWQYYGEGCVLDLFIYAEGGGRRVAHQSLRSTSGEPPAACVRTLIESRRTPQPS